jgi:DnaJ-class molecular chaperone
VGNLATAEIRALAKVIDELDYYQLLEIPREATTSELKRAYYESSRRFHPDANRHLDGELRTALEAIAKRITEAYSIVRDPRRRKAYDQRLRDEGGSLRMQLADADAAVYLLAQQDLGRGDFASAARNLQMARTFEPENKAFKQKLEEIRGKLQSR